MAADPTPMTMKAVQLRVTGGPEVLSLVDLPEPQPGPGEVRVRAHAIGAGGPDVLIRNGTYKWMPPLPAIPGSELIVIPDCGHLSPLERPEAVCRAMEGWMAR